MRTWKKVLAVMLSTVICVTSGFGFGAKHADNLIHAETTQEYPVQKFRIVIGDSDRNINITGFGDDSPLNSWITNGEENEKWYLEYQAEGVYKILNARTNKAITADNGRCTIDTVNGQSNQLWKIIGTDKDFNGDYLFYKIVSCENENMAVTFHPEGNKVMLDEYQHSEYQKFKIHCDGLEGFAGNCQVAEGEKAATIGGLFGETVYVDTLEELKNALVEKQPLTIVLTENIDCSGENYDWRIEDNKTLIGSYEKHQLMDCKLRTNDYFAEEEPSDNIIVRNIRFQIEKNEDMMAFAIYSSRNIWIDHCDFHCDLQKEYNEVGKFIWINTPYEGKDLDRSPDFMTFSYNTFSNRFWGIAFGTQNQEVDKDRATMIYNIFDSIVQRAPQMGNGTLHVMNNYYVRKTSSIDNAGMEQIKCGANSKIYSVSNRFEGFLKESSGYWDKEMTVYSDSVITDVNSYTDKAEQGGASPYKISISTEHIENTEKPENFYGYKVLSAYNANGENDVKAFCQLYSGCVKSNQPAYITDSQLSGFIVQNYTAPFVKSIEIKPDTTEEPTTEEVTTQEITTEQATTQEITTQEVTTEQATTQEATTEQVTTQEVTTEQATAEERTTQEVTTQEPRPEPDPTQTTTEQEPEQEETTQEPRPEPDPTQATTEQEPEQEETTQEPRPEQKPTQATTESEPEQEETTQEPRPEQKPTQATTESEPEQEETTQEPRPEQKPTQATTESEPEQEETTQEPRPELDPTQATTESEPEQEETTQEPRPEQKPTQATTEQEPEQEVTTQEPRPEPDPTQATTEQEPEQEETTQEPRPEQKPTQATTEQEPEQETTTEQLVKESETTQEITTEDTHTIAVEQISIMPSFLVMTVGELKDLAVNITPFNADNQKIIWTSTNTNVAIPDQNGKICAVAAGVTTIIAMTADGEKKAYCSIVVNQQSYNATETEQPIVSESSEKNVIPKKVTALKKSVVKGKVKLSWKKQIGITGYKVYKYNTKSKKYKIYKTTSKNYILLKCKKNKQYKFKVRAYIKGDTSNVYGKLSKVIKIVAPF